jgi:hypothetical protein
MHVNCGLLRQRPAAAAPFWNSTGIHMASFSTTSIPSDQDQTQREEQRQEQEQHEEAFAAISGMNAHSDQEVDSDSIEPHDGNEYDFGYGANMEFASPLTKTTTIASEPKQQIVTIFDMRRACTDILECLPDPESNNAHNDRNRSSSHGPKPKLTWKFKWQRAASSAKYQLEQHRSRSRSLTATYAVADASVDGMVLHDNFSVNDNANNDQAIGMALALLRVLPEDAWKSFDALGLEEDDDNNDDFNDADADEVEDDLVVNKEQPQQTSEYTTRSDAHLVPQDEGDDDDDDDYDEIARLLDLVANAKVGRLVLQTSDYNAILARFAIAPELTVERTLESVMQTYQQMVEMAKVGMTDSGPDATTYELLMHTLNRRLSSSNTAVEIMQAMMQSNGVGWTPQTMKAAFQLCQGRNDLKSARIVLKDVVADKSRSFKIPSGVLLAYLDMLKSEDAQTEALDLLKLSMEVSTSTVCAAVMYYLDMAFLTIVRIIP